MTNKTKTDFAFFITIFLFIISCNGERKNEVADKSIFKNQEDTFKISSADTLVQQARELSIAEPICVDYPETSSFSPSEESYYSFAKRKKNYFKGKTRLTEKFVKQQLFLNTDSVFIQNIWTGDTGEKTSVKERIAGSYFYLTDTVLNMQDFIGVIYEEIGNEGSIKHLCTFDKSGKLISKISIAFYMHSGSSTGDDGSRMPWYAKKKGCIERDLTINFISQNPIDKKYKIQPDGQIVETK